MLWVVTNCVVGPNLKLPVESANRHDGPASKASGWYRGRSKISIFKAELV